MNIGELMTTLGTDDTQLDAAAAKYKKLEQVAVTSVNKINQVERKQMGIIEEIEERLERLNVAKKKAFKYEDIEKYNKKIAETKYYLKEYEQAGLTSNKAVGDAVKNTGKNTDGVIKTMRRLNSVISTLAIGAVIMVAKKAFDSFGKVMHSTNRTGDEFKIVMSGIKFQLDEVTRSLATGGLKGLGVRLKEAAENGRDLAKQLDLIFNLSLQLDLIQADITLQMSQQKLIYRNRANSDAVRMEAAKKYLELNKQGEEEALTLAQEQVKAAMMASSIAAAKLPEDRLRWYVENARLIKDNEEALDDYLKTQKKLDYQLSLSKKVVTSYLAAGTLVQDPVKIKEYQKALEDTDKTIGYITKDYAKWANITDEDLVVLKKSWVELGTIMSEANEKALRPTMTVAQLLKEEEKEVKNLIMLNNTLFESRMFEARRQRGDPEFDARDMKGFGRDEKPTELIGRISYMEIMNDQLRETAILEESLGSIYDANSARADIYYQAMQKMIAGGFTLKDEVLVDIIEKFKLWEEESKKLENIQTIVDNIAMSFANVGRAMDNTAGSWISFVGQVISAIPTLITNINAIAAAQKAQAIAGAVAGANAVPFPFNLIALGTSIAATLIALATSIPGLAGGGVVPPGYPNDSFLARLTSGETITPAGNTPLEKADQYGFGKAMTHKFEFRDVRIGFRELWLAVKEHEDYLTRTT